MLAQSCLDITGTASCEGLNMVVNRLLNPGDRYVAIYRDALPMLVRFCELKHGDILLLNTRRKGKYEEASLAHHNAELSGEDWFVHDVNLNAIFPEDCDGVCVFDCEETPEYILSAMIKLINTKLIQCNKENARVVLRNLGCNEKILRKIGYGFLFDHVGI